MTEMFALTNCCDLFHLIAGLSYLIVSALAYLFAIAKSDRINWSVFAIFAFLAAGLEWLAAVSPALRGDSAPIRIAILAFNFTALLAFAALSACKFRKMRFLDAIPTALSLLIAVVAITAGVWRYPFALVGAYGFTSAMGAVYVMLTCGCQSASVRSRPLVWVAVSIACFYLLHSAVFLLPATVGYQVAIATLQMATALLMLCSLYKAYRAAGLGNRLDSKMKLVYRLCLILLLSTVALGIYISRVSSVRALQEFESDVMYAARSAATSFDDAALSSLSGTVKDQGTPGYSYTVKHLQNIIALNRETSFTYLMGSKNGRVFFYADWSEQKKSHISEPGDLYPEATQTLKNVFVSKQPVTEISTDRWGTWVSGLVPIIDQVSGKTIAVFGLDYGMDIATAHTEYRKVPALVTSMLLCVLILAFALIFHIQNDAKLRVEESLLRAMNAEKEALDLVAFQNTYLDSIPTPVFYQDLEGVLMGCNQAFEAYACKSRKDMIGTCLEDSYLAPIADSDMPGFAQSAEEQKVHSFSRSLDAPDGSVREVICFNSIFSDSDGKPLGKVGTIVDITQIKSMEADLALEKERLQITLQSIGDAVIATNDQGQITLMNKVAQKLTGWDEEETIGLPVSTVFRIMNEQSGQSVESPVDHVLSTGRPVEMSNHTYLVSKHGEYCSIANSCASICDASRKMIGAVLVFRDVSRQTQDRKMLQEAELRYRTLFEENPNGVCLVDAETALPVEFNESMCNLLGYTAETFSTIPVYRHHVDIQEQERVQERLRMPVGERGFMDARLVSVDGQLVDVQMVMHMLQIDSRKLCSVILLDMTWRKQTEIELRQSEKRFRSMVQNSSDVIWVLDEEASIIYSSTSVERILGYSIDSVLDTSAFDYLDPEDADFVKERFTKGLAVPNGEARWEARARKQDGSCVWLQCMGRNMLQDPHISGVVVNFSDITERKEREAIERMQNTAVNAASDQIVITDIEGYIKFVNKSFEAETGYSAAEVLGKKPSILSSGRHDDDFYANLWQTILAGKIWSGEVVNRRKDRSLYIDDMNITPVKNDQGEIECFIAIKRNVTDRKSYEEQLDHLAHHDHLTGLPNRLMFNDKLNQSLKIAKTSGKGLAILFIDLDRFKNINDTLGHNAGDALLRETAERFKRCLRESDILARMGGDEFTIIVNDIRSTQDAYNIAERIQYELSRAYVLEGHEVIISSSIGISVYPESGADSRSLIMNADTAMYRAKEQGRNKFLVYSETMNTRAMQRLKLEYGLRRALEREEFVLHYQPRVNAQTGELVGAEALLRWMHPEEGLIPPGDFIPMAEETGLIVQIGEWVIQEAIKQNHLWQQMGLAEICLSINVSPRQFQEAEILLSAIGDGLSSTGILPHNLEIEITEGALMDHPEDAIIVLNKLKNMGLKISIDDFGTGYSSLSYLKRFPIDAVKIDRSFIQDIHENPEDASICCAIIAMAHSLGMFVVAEGVETQQQYDHIRGIGCNQIQGYLTGRPQAADMFLSVLQEFARKSQQAA